MFRDADAEWLMRYPFDPERFIDDGQHAKACLKFSAPHAQHQPRRGRAPENDGRRFASRQSK
jgi:hypothetical protein